MNYDDMTLEEFKTVEDTKEYDAVKNEMIKGIKDGTLSYWMAFYEQGSKDNKVIYRHDIVECSKQVFIHLYDNSDKAMIEYRCHKDKEFYTAYFWENIGV